MKTGALNRDFFAGLCGLALAGVYYALTLRIQTSQLADEVGPDGLPRIYAFGLGGFSALLMVRALFARRPPADAKARPAAQEFVALRRAIGMLAIGVAYVVVVPFLGYPLAIAAVIAAAALYQGGRISGTLFLTAALGALGLWFVFVYLLHIGQPEGVWSDLVAGWRS